MHPSLKGSSDKLINMDYNYELFGSTKTPHYVDNWTYNTTAYNNYNNEYLTNG